MKSTFFKCLLLAVFTIVLVEITNSILDFKGLLYNSIAEKLTHKEIKQFFTLQEKWKWVTYVFVPLLIFVKTAIITSVLYISTYFFSTVAVTLKQLWAVVVQAEFVFFILAYLSFSIIYQL